MGTLAIVFLALLSVFLNVDAEDAAVSEITFINPDTVVSTVLLSPDNTTLQIVCSLMVPSINSCRMVRSDGTILTLAPYIGIGRYSYYGKGTYQDSRGNTIVDCGMEVQKVKVVDLLSWQCIMSHGKDNTVAGSYVDILKRDDPLLEGINNFTDVDTGNQKTVRQAVGKTFELMCSRPSVIKYCWFRSPNTSQIIPIPGASDPRYEYVGRGLSFGECGIKIKNASPTDTGKWTCNMGSFNDIDIRRTIPVTIYRSGVQEFSQIDDKATIGCRTFDNSMLEYCRFVRPDGQGINPLYAKGPCYVGNRTNLEQGLCQLTINDLGNKDWGTWTCAGKPPQGTEEYRETINIYRFEYSGSSGWNAFSWVLYFIFVAGMVIIMLALLQRTKMGARLEHSMRSYRQSFKDKNKNKSEKQIEAERAAY